MTFRHLRSAAVGVTIALLAVPAMAQQPAAQQNSTVAPGPPIPGVCIYGGGRVIRDSKVGKYAGLRMDTITQQVNAELNGIRNQLLQDQQAWNTQVQAGSLSQAQAEQQQLVLRQRDQQLTQLIQVRAREVELTEQRVFQRIGTETDPLVRAAVQESNCSVLLDQQAAMLFAPAMDITDKVIAKLDAKIVEFPLDRERIENQQAAGAAPPAAAPAAGRAGPPAPGRGGAAAPGRGGR